MRHPFRQGAVNLGMDTLAASSATAWAVLSVHCLLVCSAAVGIAALTRRHSGSGSLRTSD